MRLNWLGLLLMPLLLLGCAEEDENTPSSAALRGRVLNAAGAGVEGLAVVADLVLPYPSAAGDTLIQGMISGISTLVTFTLPEAAWVVITVHDLQSGGVLDTLLSEARLPGNHAVAWDLRDHDGLLLPADLYPLRLVANGQELAYLALVNPDHASAPLPWHRQATTDEDGAFTLQRDQLPIRHDYSYTLVDESGVVLGTWDLEPRLRVHLANNQGWVASSEVVEIPADSAAVLEMVLPAD